MKFLVLACFVCAASAANLYNPVRATASAFVSAPGYVANPVVKTVPEVRVVPVQKYGGQFVAKSPVVAKVPPVFVAPVVPAVKVVGQVGQEKDVNAQILKSESEVNPEGFSYSYETSNGLTAQAEGVVNNVNNVPTLNVRGQYSYYNEDGTPVHVSYVADENGFQPSSDILPKAHPIPEAIQRALRYIEEQTKHQVNDVKKFN